MNGTLAVVIIVLLLLAAFVLNVVDDLFGGLIAILVIQLMEKVINGKQ